MSIEFEIFSDPSYYDMWALRPVGVRDFNNTLHFNTMKDAQFAAQVIGNWMINDTRRNPTAGPQCKTCKGFGMVGGSIGQTPENFGYEDWPCPDCTDNTNTQN